MQSTTDCELPWNKSGFRRTLIHGTQNTQFIILSRWVWISSFGCLVLVLGGGESLQNDVSCCWYDFVYVSYPYMPCIPHCNNICLHFPSETIFPPIFFHHWKHRVVIIHLMTGVIVRYKCYSLDCWKCIQYACVSALQCI